MKGILKEQLTPAEWQSAFVRYSLKDIDQKKKTVKKVRTSDLIGGDRGAMLRTTRSSAGGGGGTGGFGVQSRMSTRSAQTLESRPFGGGNVSGNSNVLLNEVKSQQQ